MFSYRRRGGVRYRGRTSRSVFPLTLFALQLCFLSIVVTTFISPYTRSCNSIVPVVVSFTPIQPKQYYPWNDGRDYDRICSLTKQFMGQNNAKPIIMYGSTGGLGHKYTCFLHDIAIALSGKRPVKIYMPEAFWHATSPCFTDRSGKDISGIRLCNRTNPCLVENNRTFDVSNQLTNEVIAFSDERPRRTSVMNGTIRSQLKAYGIMKRNDSFYDYDRMMLRLLLNPSYDLRYIILKEKRRFFAQRPVLGVQIRTAGLLADKREHVSFINETELQRIPQLIMDTIANFQFSDTLKGIYLSSDSRIAEDLVNRTVGMHYPILTTNLFVRGHTTMNPKDAVVNRALIDVFMLAECDGLLTTYKSGFGAISSILSRARRKSLIPVTRQIVEIPFPSRKH